MRIVHRDPSLKYPRAIYREKQQIVLDWLWEFRFSSFALLAQRLGLTCQTSYKFFRLLRNNGLVQRFTNVYSNHAKYYMLTRAGAAVLHEAGRDRKHACTAPSRLIRYPHTSSTTWPFNKPPFVGSNALSPNVIAAHHITIPEPFHRPDMLMRTAERLLDRLRI